ncbi:uncharacterized protein [Clytia hemisphaerica]|uniref:uncharacterized protein n=1 Tax=Clytia hemisphaerica TaxID=252671 RepID=UPI0034D7A7A7
MSSVKLGIKIPDYHGQYSGWAGTVYYSVTNIDLQDIDDQGWRMVDDGNGGMTLVVKGITLKAKADVSYRYLLLRDTTTISINGGANSFEFGAVCKMKLNKLDIKFNGGADWFYKFVAGVAGDIKSHIQQPLEKGVCKYLEDMMGKIGK